MIWFLSCSLLLLVVHENDKESFKKNNSVKVDTQAFVNWVISLLGLGIVNNFLYIIENKGAKKDKTSVKPDVKESWAWVEHLKETDSNHTSTSHTESTTPSKELLTWGIVSNETKTSNSDTSGEKGIINDWHAGHLDKWNH